MTHSMISQKVEALLADANTDEEKAKVIFYYIRDEIPFQTEIGRFFITAEDVFEEGKGSCITKASLMVTMMRMANIPARFRFVSIRREGLKDVVHPFIYFMWPDPFIHTYPEIELDGEWIACDATYDKVFHEKLKEKRLNFGKDNKKRGIDIDFSKKGVLSAQDLYLVEDAGYGEDLQQLREYIKGMSFFKKLMMPLGRYLSIKQIEKIRR